MVETHSVDVVYIYHDDETFLTSFIDEVYSPLFLFVDEFHLEKFRVGGGTAVSPSFVDEIYAPLLLFVDEFHLERFRVGGGTAVSPSGRTYLLPLRGVG